MQFSQPALGLSAIVRLCVWLGMQAFNYCLPAWAANGIIMPAWHEQGIRASIFTMCHQTTSLLTHCSDQMTCVLINMFGSLYCAHQLQFDAQLMPYHVPQQQAGKAEEGRKEAEKAAEADPAPAESSPAAA